MPDSFRFCAVLLAAGASRRMGQPKMLLPWGPTSILGHLVQCWRRLRALQIGVVTASNHEVILSELDRLSFPKDQRIVNPAPERGMFSSIQAAALWEGWLPQTTHWAIVLGDQPHLAAATLEHLLAFSQKHSDKVCQLLCQGRRRHPVILPRWAWEEVKNSKAENLKQFLEPIRPKSALCPIDDPGLDLDLDFPADYQAALRLYPPDR